MIELTIDQALALSRALRTKKAKALETDLESTQINNALREALSAGIKEYRRQEANLSRWTTTETLIANVCIDRSTYWADRDEVISAWERIIEKLIG